MVAHRRAGSDELGRLGNERPDERVCLHGIDRWSAHAHRFVVGSDFCVWKRRTSTQNELDRAQPQTPVDFLVHWRRDLRSRRSLSRYELFRADDRHAVPGASAGVLRLRLRNSRSRCSEAKGEDTRYRGSEAEERDRKRAAHT